jgi:hypothetical protein
VLVTRITPLPPLSRPAPPPARSRAAPAPFAPPRSRLSAVRFSGGWRRSAGFVPAEGCGAAFARSGRKAWALSLLGAALAVARSLACFVAVGPPRSGLGAEGLASPFFGTAFRSPAGRSALAAAAPASLRAFSLFSSPARSASRATGAARSRPAAAPSPAGRSPRRVSILLRAPSRRSGSAAQAAPPSPHPFRPAARVSFWVPAALAHAACATLAPRNAVPEDEMAQAAPYGIVSDRGPTRELGDSLDPETLEKIVAYRAAPLRRRHGDAIAAGRSVPEVALLPSGGGPDGAFGAGLLNGWTARGGGNPMRPCARASRPSQARRRAA